MADDNQKQGEQPRQRGPNKIDVLEKEVALLRTLVLGLANYTGNDSLMAQLGVPHSDLHKVSAKEMRKK